LLRAYQSLPCPPKTLVWQSKNDARAAKI
jgi:hypothetical protein